MELVKLFAHGGEEHTDTVEAVTHSITPWYVAVPIFLLAVVLVGYIVWLLSGKKLNTFIFILTILLLISGFTLFYISVAVSIISITAGIILAGVLAFSKFAGDSGEL